MRIGLISDTHGVLRPAVFKRFDGVDRILHAGDIGPADLLAELEAVAPVTAVWGNTDDFEIRARVPETTVVEADGWRIRIVHGHRLSPLEPVRLRAAFPDEAIVVFGHTHQAVVDRSEGRLVVNPGAAGPARFGLAPSIALMTLSPDNVEVEVIEL